MLLRCWETLLSSQKGSNNTENNLKEELRTKYIFYKVELKQAEKVLN